MRLIDADALVERWKRLASYSWNEAIATSWSHAYEEIISEIEEAPTVEAEPVRHGEWILKPDELFPTESIQECSVCHAEESLSMWHDKYCPNCGAKMDGKKAEEKE